MNSDWISEELTLPDACAVRLIDLDERVGALTSVDETGFVNIYLNARLSRDGQLRALKHELRHQARGDLYSEADIRVVERAADSPRPAPTLAIDGTPLERPVIDPSGLRPVGRGLYMPVGAALARAGADIAELSRLLRRAFQIFDIAQTPPLLPVGRLETLARALCAEDIAFIAFQPDSVPTALPAALRIFRESGGRLQAALFYDARALADNALAIMDLPGEPAFRITVDLRRRAGRLDVHAITRQLDGGAPERMY